MDATYKVIFKFTGLKEGPFTEILKNAMTSEFAKAYNIYANIANAGVTDKLNKEFDVLYPDYIMPDDFTEATLYNQFMADGYTTRICKELNAHIEDYPLLEFYVDPEEVSFKGQLRMYHEVTIEMFLKPEEP